MNRMEWNQATGNYEHSDGQYEITVPGDVMSEAKDEYAQEKFGVSYEDADDAQTQVVDDELESIAGWSDYMIREAAK